MWIIPFLVILLVAALASAEAQSRPYDPQSAPYDPTVLLLAPPARGTCDRMRQSPIRADDVLLILVRRNAAMSQRVPVRPDGKISLPLLHEVQAAGLTPLELRDVLTQRLAEFKLIPEVLVIGWNWDCDDIRRLSMEILEDARLHGIHLLSPAELVLISPWIPPALPVLPDARLRPENLPAPGLPDPH